MHNIIRESLLCVETTAGDRLNATLPQVYALMGEDRIESFVGLRRHQRHAWHAFLTQLGVIAVERSATRRVPETALEWENIITDLTAAWPQGEPWELVVDDITKPAFLQPPVVDIAAADDYKNESLSPDNIDLLVNAKNHDLKSTVALWCDPEDWVYALVSLQTGEGFGGAGNYGISRMNGGVGSRTACSLSPEGGPGAAVMRDLGVLLASRQAVIADHGTAHRGAALLWTLPWQGNVSELMDLSQLDPYYIEVCRRIRLQPAAEGRLKAVRAVSRSSRINSKQLAGVVGDPWSLVDIRKENAPKTLTMAAGGFTYRRVLAYLTDRKAWKPPVTLMPAPGEDGQPMTVRAMCLVRGQGKTAGWHERYIPLAPTTVAGCATTTCWPN